MAAAPKAPSPGRRKAVAPEDRVIAAARAASRAATPPVGVESAADGVETPADGAPGAETPADEGFDRSHTGKRLSSTSFQPGQSGNLNGRPKGSVSYRDLLTAEDRARIAATAGCTPLQYLLSVMLDPFATPGMRLDAAKNAAPYMHKKMPIAVEQVGGTTPMLDVNKLLKLPREDREKLLTLLRKSGIATPPDIPTAVAASLAASEELPLGAMPPVSPTTHGGPAARILSAYDEKGVAPGGAYRRSMEPPERRAPVQRRPKRPPEG